jgi:cell division protein ZapA
MAQVSLHINGYAYILSCGDGEEEHLFTLAADLDRRIEEIKASSGPSGEARLLLMAALVVADELHDLHDDVQRLEAALQQAPAQHHETGSAPPAKAEPKAGRRLRGLTRRAEALAASAEALPVAEAPDPSTDRS